MITILSMYLRNNKLLSRHLCNDRVFENLNDLNNYTLIYIDEDNVCYVYINSCYIYAHRSANDYYIRYTLNNIY